MLCDVLGAGAELHLVDPYGTHADALPRGWGASEWATRRTVARAVPRRDGDGPDVHWHVARSHDVALAWQGAADLVFIDGDHSEEGCELDWSDWSAVVPVGGRVVFHDARAGRTGGRGLPGPTAVVERCVRTAGPAGWEIEAEGDRTVVALRVR